MPLITLPQSLLLQDGQNGDRTLAHNSAAANVRATAAGEDYAHDVWTALQDSTKTMIDEARDAFFASDKISGAPNGSAVTTTVAAQTTPDPVALAKQLKISVDAAKARIMLTGMIKNSQDSMLKDLEALSEDMRDTDGRAKADLSVIKFTYGAAGHLPIIANTAEAAAEKVEKHAKQLDIRMAKIRNKSASNLRLAGNLLDIKDTMKYDIAAAKQINGGKPRVQINYQTFQVLSGRLEHLAKRISRIERRLYDGNITQLVSDTATDEVQNVMEDMSRGFGRYLPNAR